MTARIYRVEWNEVPVYIRAKSRGQATMKAVLRIRDAGYASSESWPRGLKCTVADCVPPGETLWCCL
jgi:hypothetical protein